MKSKTLGPFTRGKIRRVLHRTRLKEDANFPFKRHISSKIRRGLAKTRKMNDLRVLHKTRTYSTHALTIGAPRWIAVATGNIHMKTNQEQK